MVSGFWFDWSNNGRDRFYNERLLEKYLQQSV